jgi:transcriptional regulator with XRE-family HTH domain
MKSKQINQLVAKNLKRLRLKAGLTQQEMATQGGFSYKYFQKIESGSCGITMKTLSRFTEILKVHPQYFFKKIS